MLASLLPAGTPGWLSLSLGIVAVLVAARFLLGALRRGRVGTLVLVAAAWAWFFWPPGHAWMLGAWHTALAEGRALLPSLLGQVKSAASQSAGALASAAAKRGASALARAGRPRG